MCQINEFFGPSHGSCGKQDGSSALVASNQGLERRQRQGSAKQIALKLTAAIGKQSITLGLGLYPFRNHLQAHGLPQADDGAHDGRVIGVME